MAFKCGSFEDFLDVRSVFNENKEKFLEAYERIAEDLSTENLHNLRICSRKFISFLNFIPKRYLKSSMKKYEENFEKIINKSGKLRDIQIINSFYKEFSVPEEFIQLQNEIKDKEEKKFRFFYHSLKVKKLINKEFTNLMVSKEFVFLENMKKFKNFIKGSKLKNFSDKESIHNFRIQIKTFKYQFEFLKDFKDLLQIREQLDILQKHSGRIHDLELFRKELNSFNKDNSKIIPESVFNEIKSSEKSSCYLFEKEFTALRDSVK